MFFCKDKQCYYICFFPQEFLEQTGHIPPCLFLPTIATHTSVININQVENQTKQKLNPIILLPLLKINLNVSDINSMSKTTPSREEDILTHLWFLLILGSVWPPWLHYINAGEHEAVFISSHLTPVLAPFCFTKKTLFWNKICWKCLGEILIKGSEGDNSFCRWLTLAISNWKGLE